MSEAAAATRKARGAFFTPGEIARFLADWAIRSPADRVLEPSCGEAAFLVSAAQRLAKLGKAPLLTNQIEGVDIHEESIAFAARELARIGAEARLSTADFFDLRAYPRFDAVVGNPPYVRYQSFTGTARAKALEAALAQGIRLTGLASSWAAFVVHASAFLKPEGRLALVLPAELLSVHYAAPVRRFLMHRFSRVRLVLFEERVFPGVQEEVVLLLAEGTGPTRHCELFQSKDLEELDRLDERLWTPADTGGKWTAGLLDHEAVETYFELLQGRGFGRLEEWGDTTLGMVSGNNRYFALTASRVRELGLEATDLLSISPPGSRHLRGVSFTERAWRSLRDGDAPVYLFDPPGESPSGGALRYIEAGETIGVPAAYKCRVRSPWWKVPRVQAPDLFLTYMNSDFPRLVTNRARVHYLNSVHGVTLRRGRRRLGRDLLPIAALNSVTLLGAELVGRSYGGGMLKVEPKEADALPVPSLATLELVQEDLRRLRTQLLRGRCHFEVEEVVTEVDRILLRGGLRMQSRQIKQLAKARAKLSGRRRARGRSRP